MSTSTWPAAHAANVAIDAASPPRSDQCGKDARRCPPVELPRVAEHFAPVLAAAAALRDELASLTGGSSNEQARLADLVAALDAENANARAKADAARRSDVGTFTSTLPAVETLTTARIDAADALGTSHCATP